jgi:hypothetical protein
MRYTLLTVALSVLVAMPAAAQQPLKISFQDGRVSIDATSVPVRAILTEWAKAGGTKIVGAERISGAPMTVKLVNVTEAQALETILRSVAGYMAAPRNTLGGPSMYDRILVMATSSAPPPPAAANARPGAQPNNAFNGTQRFVPPRREQPEQQEPDEAPEPDENPPSPPVFTFPQPGVNQPGQFQNAPPNAGQPGSITVNPANGGNVTISPSNPSSPSGPVGVSQPGMMVNPPAPNQPVPPGTMIRPPRGGGNQ